MANKRKYFVGQVYKVPSGEFEIVELDKGTYKHATISWLKDGNQQRIRLDVIERGNIKNPMFPSVCGAGFIGVGNYSTKDMEMYNSWSSMIARSYRKKLKDKYKTYTDVTCVDYWLNYQNYCDFYEADPYRKTGWNLDKDLLVLGNKIYSPETCLFLPPTLNTASLSMPVTTKEHGFRGVLLCKRSGKWMSVVRSDHTLSGKTTGGRYDDIKLAATDYLLSEINNLENVVKNYSGLIDPRGIDALHLRARLNREELECL